jgi:hypothetical protein
MRSLYLADYLHDETTGLVRSETKTVLEYGIVEHIAGL